jgi:ABC-2 type transport system permease protein
MMNKILIIAQREFVTRVRKRSFIIMAILGPIIFAGFFATSIYFASSAQDIEIKKIAVIDSTGAFIKRIPDSKTLKFEFLLNAKVEVMKKILKKTDYYGILYISPLVSYSSRAVQFYSYEQPSLQVTQYISNAIEKELRDQKLLAYNIKNIDNILKSVETRVAVETVKMNDSGVEKKSDTGLLMGVAYVSSFLIYMFIFMFGMQVMRGVMEEKSSRIVEVMISSVKPFQLMMGKVIGVAATALVQLMIWVILTFTLVTIIKASVMPDISPVTIASQPHNLMDSSKTIVQTQVQASEPNADIANILSMLDSINFFVVIGSFIFYFIGGYLLYASLFAAIGAAVDHDSDTQQFTLPITLPLILGIMVMINALQNPNSDIAFWFSLIPFTSPIVMMARIPYGVPYWQVGVSMTLLILTFIGTIWLAGKIYRTGILMYGKKISFGEMLKWLKYKN